MAGLPAGQVRELSRQLLSLSESKIRTQSPLGDPNSAAKPRLQNHSQGAGELASR